MSRVVLFVCTANICRSPMAAALFNAYAQKQGEGDAWVGLSAGTWSAENQAATGHAITALARRGIALQNHRAHQITRLDIANAALVLVMTRNHRDALVSEFPAFKNKIHLMSELDGREYDIADPYGSDLEEYLVRAQDLERLIERGYARIQTWAQDNPS